MFPTLIEKQGLWGINPLRYISKCTSKTYKKQRNSAFFAGLHLKVPVRTEHGTEKPSPHCMFKTAHSTGDHFRAHTLLILILNENQL